MYILNLLRPRIYHDLHVAPAGIKLPSLDDKKICQNLINFWYITSVYQVAVD